MEKHYMWCYMRRFLTSGGDIRAIYMAFLAVLASIAVPETGHAVSTVVTDIRVGEHGKTTRIAFDLSKRVDFNIFTLSNPYRVVIDFPEIGWRLPARPLPVRKGLFKSLRYGLFKPGTTRVVVDVNGPVTVDNIFMLQPSGMGAHRLVVDIVASAKQASGGSAVPPAAKAKIVTAARSIASPPPRKPERNRVVAAVKRRKPMIVIDPGHGGMDPGTVGLSGTYEKNVTLSAARAIKSYLQNSGKYRVRLTRDRDRFIRLRSRVAFARKVGAELFISIHANSTSNHRTRGLSVYTLSEKASDKEAAALAEKENKVDLIAGIDLNGESPEVTNILIDLAQRESMNQSAHFAAELITSLKRETRFLRNTHRFAGFAVLKAPDIPSVLIELGFLSNRSDEKSLRSRKFRSGLAAAIANAVDKYFSRVEEANRR